MNLSEEVEGTWQDLVVRLFHFISHYLKIQVLWDVTPYRLATVTQPKGNISGALYKYG
jgi:hypothetical protein